MHFIVASFAVLFIAFYVIFYLPKGKVEAGLLALLEQVLEYDFYIILSGLGFITADNLAQTLLERAKAKVAGNIAVGSPSADTIQVDNLNVKQTVTGVAPVSKTEPPIEPNIEQDGR